MATSDQLRAWWAPWFDAEATKGVDVAFPGDGRVWVCPVADAAGQAFTILATLMSDHGVLFLDPDGGTWNVRPIAGTDKWSLHSYGIALDLNPDTNPYGQCSTTLVRAFIDAVLALRTGNDRPVFSWGGNWRPCEKADPMHFQIDCEPGDLATGIVGYAPPEMAGIDFVAEGDKGQAVRYWQRVLNNITADIPVDGVYGAPMVAAVKAILNPDAKPTGSDGKQIGNWEAFQLHLRVFTTPGGPHNHPAGGLAIESLDKKSIKGKTGPASSTE